MNPVLTDILARAKTEELEGNKAERDSQYHIANLISIAYLCDEYPAFKALVTDIYHDTHTINTNFAQYMLDFISELNQVEALQTDAKTFSNTKTQPHYVENERLLSAIDGKNGTANTKLTDLGMKIDSVGTKVASIDTTVYNSLQKLTALANAIVQTNTKLDALITAQTTTNTKLDQLIAKP